MLVLSRQTSESLLIGDNIRITVLRCDGSGTVSLGIDAPRDILVIREELEMRAGSTTSGRKAPSASSSKANQRSLLTRLKSKVLATQ